MTRCPIRPVGKIEDDWHQVRWPPEFEMSVPGYHEALELTETVLLDDVEVRVIPLCAFGPLKLLAWSDRRLGPTAGINRDSEDFCFVLTNFWEPRGNTWTSSSSCRR